MHALYGIDQPSRSMRGSGKPVSLKPAEPVEDAELVDDAPVFRSARAAE